MTRREAGRLGGEATLRAHGAAHYTRITKGRARRTRYTKEKAGRPTVARANHEGKEDRFPL